MTKLVKRIGAPRLIIGAFLLVMLVLAGILAIPLPELISVMLVRIGMNGILVLAMVPAIKSGTGLNFALPIGVVCGLVGALVSIEFKMAGFMGLALSLAIAIPIATVAGYFYGRMLNKVKGDEMTVGTYMGYSVVSFMCIFWLLAPFKSPELIWPYGGNGVRVTVSLASSIDKVLDSALAFKVFGVTVPTGLLLFFGAACLLVYVFYRTKSGVIMEAAGANEKFAIANGIDVDKQRIIGTVMSTVLAAVGIIVYSQSFGFLQLYTAPLYSAFPAVAAILIGGATIRKASISNAIVGTLLFQSLLVVSLPVINLILGGSMSEVIRIIVSNGIILYALTRRSGGETLS